MTEAPAWPKTVAFMDVGTNSIRLIVIRIESNQSYTVLHRLKETVRLGEGEFAQQVLQPEAIQRAAAVVKRFAQIAESSGADETIAVATAATREAANRNDFLNHVQAESGIDLHVISGMEEARLIYLGVASGIDLGIKQAMFIDIGGGSTETAIGTHDEHFYLNSLKLGAIRLSNQFLGGSEAPVTPQQYEGIRSYVRTHADRTIKELADHQIDLVVGSSGTIESLADVCIRLARKRARLPEDRLNYQELRDGVKLLCSLPLEERRKVPGLSPARADIIVGGAAIIDTFMEELNLQALRISDRGLREGLVEDYMVRHGHSDTLTSVPLRERSILQLGRTCRFDENHARMTARLVLRLFDGAKALGLHRLGGWEREVLEYAALLHHIGAFLTYSGYQKHSYYLVRNAELLGFDEAEITMIAAIVLYHRSNLPRRRDLEIATLTSEAQQTVLILSTLLRLAENLDRTQSGSIQDARLTGALGRQLTLELRAVRDCEVELSGLEDQRETFERVFRRKLAVSVVAQDVFREEAALQVG